MSPSMEDRNGPDEENHRKKLSPIPRHGSTLQECPRCKRAAPIEVFKDALCVGCQVENFLNSG